MARHEALRGPIVGLGSFVAMEAVSYCSHRWVMHGPGMGWHRSHHRSRTRGPHANDLFPVVFSLVGAGCFALATQRNSPALRWAGVGMSAYGAAYLYVHEVHIHRRFALPPLPTRYFAWLRAAHADHHRLGAEPYGMLLPLVRGHRRSAA